ncbi:unnamed protein product [Arabis nemorensis]|uniref:Uncharacterized protein n=1 Tax=Arabis nemorensis TaxID=586526 RepID=A0A565BGK4_9BRAS|nr:unnamed protein product [Arabis nemorensis]
MFMAERRFKAFDLGGHQIARRVWKDYYGKVDAVVYLVDANEKERRRKSVSKEEEVSEKVWTSMVKVCVL